MVSLFPKQHVTFSISTYCTLLCDHFLICPRFRTLISYRKLFPVCSACILSITVSSISEDLKWSSGTYQRQQESLFHSVIPILTIATFHRDATVPVTTQDPQLVLNNAFMTNPQQMLAPAVHPEQGCTYAG